VIKVPNRRRGSIGYTIVATARARIGDRGTIDGVTYVIRSETELRQLIREKKWRDVERTCTSRITDMNHLFYGETDFTGNIGHWDTSNVTDMRSMFDIATKFNGKIGGWNTSRVVTMVEMFQAALVFNQDIGGWDVGRVRTTEYMFHGAENFNQDLSQWNVRSLRDFSDMFSILRSTFNQDISSWIDKLPGNVHQDFAELMIEEDVRKTVRRLNLRNIFPRLPNNLFIESVQMLKIIRQTYPGYRPSQDVYEMYHDMVLTPVSRHRIIALIDFLNREEAKLPPAMWYDKRRTRPLIRSFNRETDRMRMTAMASINRAAGKKNLHIPKEVMSKILHAASFKTLPYTHAGGKSRPSR